MINDKEKNVVILPKNQLELFGYEKYFNEFVNLFHEKKLPNRILISGLKGSGKSTFLYHFINYLFSQKEERKYSKTDFTINANNKSYLNIINNIHPNFLLVENNLKNESIKIEAVKNILNFLNKSTYQTSTKIIMIDDAEYLNINSSNALLKSLEESNDNTFFFIIHNSEKKIAETIKSRCVEYKIFFNLEEKKNILSKIIKLHSIDFDINNLDNNFYLEAPGYILNYLMIFNDLNLEYSNNKISCINYLIDKFKKKKDPEILNYISFLVELFYSELSIKNNQNLSTYFYNKFKILKLLNNVKKFNLDKNNFFVSMTGILNNER
jgi:DNA polymerase III subunit delta'